MAANVPAKINVRNPRTGEIDDLIQPPTPQKIAKQCINLRLQQINWWRSGLEKRVAAMQEWKQALLLHKNPVESLQSLSIANLALV